MMSIFLLSLLGNATAQNTGDLTICFENIDLPEGHIRVALYRSEDDFMDTEKAMLYSFPVEKKGRMEVQVEGLEVGTYAFASFHDENGDGELSTNFFGIPKEAYAFSRQCPSKWRPPTFDEAKFAVKSGGSKLTVPLQRWKF